MTLALGPVIGTVGGGVEMHEPVFTPNTSSTRATLATQVVGDGQWLVAAQISQSGTWALQMWINDVDVFSTTGGGPRSSTAVVDGPTTIVIEGSRISSGSVRIVRID